MRRFPMLLVALLSALVLSACTSTTAPSADLIVTNGRVFTGGSTPWAEAVAIRGERIVSVGNRGEVEALRGPSTRVVDVAGRLVVPGINDAHVHAPWAEEPLVEASVPRDAATVADVLQAIRDAAASAPDGKAISASLPLALVDSRLTRDDLDSISSTRPIRVTVFGGHSAILNTAALRAWQIPEAASDPLGGSYGRSEGRLSGWVYEHAYWKPQKSYAENVSDAELLEALRAFEDEAVRLGITSVQTYPLISAERTRGLLAKLPARLRWSVTEFRFPPFSAVEGPAASKYILDGTPIERSAAMIAPYADAPDARGALNYTVAEIEGMVRDAADPGAGQLHVHAVGDRAISAVLDAMERTPADWPARRVRIEHGDGTTPELAARARKLGVVIVQNPAHFTIDAMMRARYGTTASAIQPARSLLANGNRFAIGSDGPLNPYLNMFFAAIHPTNPAESLSVEQSLRAYTAGAAFAEFRETEKGTLAAGMLADLAVLSQDILNTPPPQLPGTQSVLTVVGGKIVWEAK